MSCQLQIVTCDLQVATHGDCQSQRSRLTTTAVHIDRNPTTVATHNDSQWRVFLNRRSRRVLFGLWDGPVNRIFTRLLNSRGLQVQNKWVCSRCGQPPLVTMQLGSIKKFREKKLIISNYSLLSAVIDHRLLVDCFSLFATVSRWLFTIVFRLANRSHNLSHKLNRSNKLNHSRPHASLVARMSVQKLQINLLLTNGCQLDKLSGSLRLATLLSAAKQGEFEFLILCDQ